MTNEDDLGYIPAWQCPFDFSGRPCFICSDSPAAFYSAVEVTDNPKYVGTKKDGVYECKGDKRAGVCNKNRECVATGDPLGTCTKNSVDKWVDQAIPGDGDL